MQEERLAEVEKAVAVAQQVALNALESTRSGFKGIHDRLDMMNGEIAATGKWKVRHDAYAEGAHDTWAAVRGTLLFGFAALGAVQAGVAAVVLLK